MADLEKKLAIFSKTILNEAEAKKEQIVAEIDKKKNSAIEKKEIELLGDAYEDIQKAVAKYSKESNERVLKIEMELKKEVIKKREEIIADVFEKAKARLEEFIESEAYEGWLAEKAKKAADEAGGGDIYVMPRDMKFKEAIEKEIPGSRVFEITNDNIIGGAIVRNAHISVDYSIKEMLENEHHNFLKTSGLSIKA